MRYSDGFGSDDGDDDEGRDMDGSPSHLSLVPYTGGMITPPKRKYSFYDAMDEDMGPRPKYKNELTTCHFCRKRDRKPKTR